MSCSENQTVGGCFGKDSNCVQECSAAEVPSSMCNESGMYGQIKKCPYPSLPPPRINEGFYSQIVSNKVSLIFGLLLCLFLLFLVYVGCKKGRIDF